MYEKVRKVVVPAAGLGTRFLPATKSVPKEMLPIVDTPTIQLIVSEAVRAGFEEVVVINGRNKDAIEDHFDVAYELEDTMRRRGKTELADEMRAISRMAAIVSIRQKEPLGLGHAVLCARPAIGREPFAVMLGDDLFDSEVPGIGQLVEVARKTGKAAVALMEVPASQTHLYGIATGTPLDDRTLLIDRLVEKPASGTVDSRLAVIGRYVLPADVFELLEKLPPGAGGEIQLTDALDILAREGRLVGYCLEGVRHDAGDKLGFVVANIAYAMKHPDLREGLLAYMKTLVEEK